MATSSLQKAEKPTSGTSLNDDLIVEATGVHKVYHTGQVSVQALRGVNLSVRRGEMVAIMGPSGSGKTTLLNCLSGLDAADQGQIAIEGVSLSGMSDRQRTAYRARRMGFVFQFYNLLPVLSAVENVELPLLVSGVRLREARKRALESLAQVGLAQRAYHRPAELSGGERQRTTIARALVNRPALVWADEPTGDLDSETAGEIMDVLVELNQEQQLTFILVTHDRSVGARCERIVRMRDGLVEDDQPGTIKEH
jgi:ABC-type lipoprotein export system ATPase subunit